MNNYSLKKLQKLHTDGAIPDEAWTYLNEFCIRRTGCIGCMTDMVAILLVEEVEAHYSISLDAAKA